MPINEELYTVVYRTGGFLNAEWHHSKFDTIEETQVRLAHMNNQGYETKLWSKLHLEAIGLPIGYCRQCDSLTGKCTGLGNECRKWLQDQEEAKQKEENARKNTILLYIMIHKVGDMWFSHVYEDQAIAKAQLDDIKSLGYPVSIITHKQLVEG